jgi:hypothetical protein
MCRQYVDGVINVLKYLTELLHTNYADIRLQEIRL